MNDYRIAHQTSRGTLYVPLQRYKPYIVVLTNGKKLESTNIVNLKKEIG